MMEKHTLLRFGDCTFDLDVDVVNQVQMFMDSSLSDNFFFIVAPSTGKIKIYSDKPIQVDETGNWTIYKGQVHSLKDHTVSKVFRETMVHHPQLGNDIWTFARGVLQTKLDAFRVSLPLNRKEVDEKMAKIPETKTVNIPAKDITGYVVLAKETFEQCSELGLDPKILAQMLENMK